MATAKRMLEDLANYAKVDKSDPFTYARGVAHLRAGMGRADQDGRDAHYKAQAVTEMRPSPFDPSFPDYAVTTYRNVERI